MARTTSTAVQAILNKDYDTVNNPDLTGYIDSVTTLVDDIATNDDAGVMTSTKLEIVERWLAAWAYCAMDPTYQTKSTGKASATFQGQAQMNLNMNRYGQAAMMFDSSGYLRALANKGLVGLTFLGSDYDTQESDEALVDTDNSIGSDD